MKKWSRKLAGMTAAVLAIGTVWNMPAANVNETTAATTNVRAFPGAVGGGSFATGGRGGTVVHVTNLNDSGTGSFREAVSGSNKIVVFDVSGTIELKSDVVVGSNITIAGQTAPGGSGITLKNYKLGFGGTNVICRFVSSRPGERGVAKDYDALGGANGTNTIVDHCSFGWANDEQWGLYSKNDYMTIQYSVIGPSNSFSYHSKGIHGFGIMFGRANVTWDHNLIVHNVSRNYRGKVTDTNPVDFTNNVIYNWASQTAYGTLGHVNYVGNTLKKGVSTVGGHNYISVGDSGTKPENYSIYLTGNRFLNIDDTQYSNYTDNNWAGIKYKNDKTEENTRSDVHFPITVNGIDVSTALTAESAKDAYDHVLSYAGNGISSEKRTAIDKQVAYEAKTGTGSLTGGRPKSEASASQLETIEKYSIQCGVKYEYPSAITTKEIVDSDNDGMEDTWELERGLDPYDAKDTNGDYCGQGYTNIEYYINDLTADAFPEGVVELSPVLNENPDTIITVPEGFDISVKDTNDVATVSGTTVTFNDPTGHDNGVVLENPFIGKDTSNGASVSFWLTPSQNISGKLYEYTSILSFVREDKQQMLKYDLEGTRQLSTVSGDKLNYWEAPVSLIAGKEYFVTFVIGENGLEYYIDGKSIGYTGYATTTDVAAAKASAMALLSMTGTALYAGGTIDVDTSMQEISKHDVPKNTAIRDIKGYVGTMNVAQVKQLYQEATGLATPAPTATSMPSLTPTATPTPSPTPMATSTAIPTSTPTAAPIETPTPAPTETIMPTATPVPTEVVLPTETPTSGIYLYGDVDMNDKVTADDALAILKHVVKLELITGEIPVILADVDQDEVITATDALETLKVVVKLKEVEEYVHIE